MDDSLAKDQLNLWEKLNRLYGEDGEPAGREGAPAGGESVPESSGRREAEGGPELVPNPEGEETRANTICEDCDKDCKQESDTFLLSRCPKSASIVQQRPSILQHGSRGSMGFDKINETCKLCRKSCKQTSKKLNLMLCLGFEPLEAGEKRG